MGNSSGGGAGFAGDGPERLGRDCLRDEGALQADAQKNGDINSENAFHGNQLSAEKPAICRVPGSRDADGISLTVMGYSGW